MWRLYDVDLFAFSFANIHFPAMVPQLPKLLALFFTVAFGSSMDVVRCCAYFLQLEILLSGIQLDRTSAVAAISACHAQLQ